jgi:drug/metabolite transporter (DMT)-like permease
MYYAFISAITNIVAVVVNKRLLSIDKMNVATFLGWLFIFLCLITGLSIPWIGFIDLEQAFTSYYVFIFLTMILLAAVWNYFYYTCLEKDNLSDFQLISIIQPLLTVILSMVVYDDERNLKVIIAAFVAGLALLLSHLFRWKIENYAITIPLFLTIILSSIESLYHKELLEVYSPAALYFTRTFFIAIIFGIIGAKTFFKVSQNNLKTTFTIAFFAVIAMVASFYGYQTIGLAKTQIIMLLFPIGSTILSVYYLKERIKKRKIVALIIIIGCIIYAFS